MRYFFPLAEDAQRAELYWNAGRSLLEEAGFPTRARRIHALAFRRGEDMRYLQVGVEDGETGEPVLLIFRAANCPYYWVCTPCHGLLGGAPIAVPDSDGTWAVDFSDDDADGGAERRPPRRRRRKASR